jgi:outer membrane autotransporter protein
VQFAELWQQGYTENSVTASGTPGVLGLTFQSHQVSSLPTFLGAQFDTHLTLANSMLWTPYARVSWVHEFEPTRDITATFLTVANSTFTVDGPRAARDATRIDVGSNLAITRTVSLFGTFNGESPTAVSSIPATAACAWCGSGTASTSLLSIAFVQRA